MNATGVLVGASVAWALGSASARAAADRAVRRRVRACRPAPGLRVRGPTPALRRMAAVVAGLGLLVLGGPWAVVLAVGAVALLRARRARRSAGDGVDAAVAGLPDAVDLLAIAARSGLPAGPAVGIVAGRAPPPWGAACAAVTGRVARGERLADALGALVDVAGEPATALRAVLRSAAEDGAELGPALDRLAVDARDARRRRAEEAARRVPVRLLLPLVACSLPALALLSIVPILAGALEALGR